MNRPLRTALALLPLLAASLLPSRSAQAASSCPGFIPATITTPVHLITAINQAQSGNCPGADTIDLGGNTLTFTAAGYIDGGDAVGLPPITTPVTLTNGTLTRSSAVSLRFLLVATGGSLTLSNLTLSNGGSGVSGGGAVRVNNGSLTTLGASFLNNSAGSASGNGGAVLISGTGTADITDTLFQGNQSSEFGGAIAITAPTGNVVVSRSQFLGNVATTHGGAISVTDGSMLQINDSLFAGNAAGVAGAALYQATGVLVVGGTTMAGNRGVAVELGGGMNSTFSNSLIWGNNGGSFMGTPMVMLYTAAEGYAGASINTGYTVYDFFVAPLAPPGTTNTGLNYNPTLYDWHLRPYAPAIDAGSNSSTTSTLDLDANPRRANDTNVSDTGTGTAPLVDLGAYERQASSCAGFSYPYTLSGSAAAATRRLNLRDAVRCANLNGSDDTIDLAGQTLTYDAPFATVDSTPTALPQITSAMTLRNGQITRSTTGGTPNFRLLANAVSGQLTLSGMTLRNGDAGNVAGVSRGGAVYNLGTLAIQQSTLSDNAAYTAGALYNAGGASATVARSALSNNIATGSASAVYTEGYLVLSNSTVSSNSSTAATSAIIGAPGSQLRIVNSTIVDNSNTSATVSAGLSSNGATQLYNSILANNTPYDCARPSGTIIFSAGTSNIIETQPAASPCGVAGTHLIAADPQLGTPAGSPAFYALSSATSPAVNAGDASSIDGATVDQPGNARVQQSVVDLGSVESPFAGQQATLAFAAATSSAAEAAGFGNLVRVTTSDGAVTASAITATVSVTGGTATAADYTLTGTLTIPAGTPDNTLVSIASAISVVNDSIVEPNETLQLTLSTPAGAVLGTQTVITHTISNDDMATLTIADVSRPEGNAGTSTMTFTVVLDNAVQGGFAVDYATTGLTATTADNDFVAASGSLMFAGIAGETQTFNVTINGDTKVEANEIFQVSMPTAAGTMTPGSLVITDTAVGTITNDDTASVTIADASVTEGNAGTVTMTFTATLDNTVQGGFTVNYATSNGTATTADADYVAASGTLVFSGNAGETHSFTVTVNGDTRVEPNETFTVSLNTVSNAGVTITDTATGTITNDDNAQLTIADVSVAEGNAGTRNLIFTVALDNAVGGGLSVNYTTANGTATTGDNDYVAASGTLNFTGTAGQTRTFVVLVNGDTKLEADETFTVALSNVSNAAVDISDTATGTITNDDAAAVTIADVSVAEGNSGTTTMTFTAILNNAVQGGFTVNYATATGTATTADNDYLAATGTLTFAGTADETQTFTVTVNGDTKVEPNETFTVSMNTVSHAGVNITDTATGTITNDDTAAVTIADVSVAEGNAGTTAMTFTATLSNAVPGGFTVNYATANGTATTADNDYVSATGTLTFAGTAGETRTFTVTVNGDARVEPDETFTVSMNTVSNAAVTITDTATGTITNDDTAAVTIADVSVVEGNSGTTAMTFTATLDNAVQGGFTVNYATANGTATTADNDYVAATGTLTFAGTAGETRTFTVTVNGDARVEPDETFTVSMNTGSNAAVTITDTATGTITNDDTAAVTIADVSVAEGNSGTTAMTFTVTLNNAVAGGFTVNYATANGTATTGDNDYVAATGTLTFAGTAGETQTFTVIVNGDTRVEPNEAFTVSLNTVSNAAVTISDTATGTITNDDTAAVTVADVSVVEGNSGTATMTFTATLGNAVAGGFTVNYASANGTATTADSDYVAATGTLTFAGTAGETQTFAVIVNGDIKLEADETFTVVLSNASNAAVDTSDSATGTITNDDTAAVTLADASVTEGNTGTTAMTFTATLDKAVQGGFTVNYASANGTATTADSDYVAATGTLTFAGIAGETQTFSVTVNGDIRFEPDETLTVALSGVSNAAVSAADTATGTIVNDDTAAGFVVTPTAVQTTEAGGGATFTVALAAEPSATVTLPLSSSDTGEGSVSPATLAFTTANWANPQTVTVTGVDDAVVDGSIAYTIVLGAATSSDPAFNGLNPPDVSATNADNDVAGVRVTPTALTATEGGTGASYTVVLDSEPVGGSVTVSVNADSQVTATPATLTFTASNWNVAQTVSVTAVDDALTEGSHSGAITHAVSGADYGSVTAASVSVAITDNDSAGIVVTPTTGLVTTEAGGSTTFTVVLASQPTADVRVALSSSDTTEGTVAPATLTFTAANWNVTQTVTVTGVDDTVVDGDVAYSVITAAATSTDADYAGVDAADVAASNRDDDGASLRIDDVTLAEGDAGSSAFAFTVTLTGTVPGGVRVNYTTADGTAMAPGDYAATSGQLSFAGSDGETRVLSVPVNGDTVFEGNEQFRVLLSGADPAVVVLSRAEGTGTITDDDATAQLAATKVVTQAGTPLQPVIYTLVVSNTGTGMQVDAAASDELVDILPPGLALQSASAGSGTAVADTASNTVRWNGALAAGASATIEIRATVVATAATSISNRAQLNYDSDGDGINDTTALSDDPTTPGADATVFFFTPAAPATPAVPVPLSGPWTLLALMLGLAGLGMRTTMRRRRDTAA